MGVGCRETRSGGVQLGNQGLRLAEMGVGQFSGALGPEQALIRQDGGGRVSSLQELCAEVSTSAFDDLFRLCTSKAKEVPALKFKCEVSPCNDLLVFYMKA